MSRTNLQAVQYNNKDVVFSSSGIKLQCSSEEINSFRDGFFASVGQAGMGFGISSPDPVNSLESSTKLPSPNVHAKYVSMPQPTFSIDRIPHLVLREVLEVGEKVVKRKGGFKLRINIGNPSLRKLISGAVAGAVSRTVVAPLETVRTHLMVGSCGNSAGEVFDAILKIDGWKGLFRGNLVNVIRVAPNKAIELFAYDTVKKHLALKPGEQPKLPIPASSIAGAVAGVSSTLCTYPLELLKTRVTVQRGLYKNLLDAFLKIVREEGPAELYRGLTPSLIGVVPYAATNYFAYDTLRKAYRKASKKEEIGNIMTLLIGSAAAAISSTATFPLEVARKYMQAGALNGRQYQNMLHALASILEKEGLPGLYKGLGPSCMKLVPAAGISFMCYEACKRILIQKEATDLKETNALVYK
ncbi:adenine nucleotide transporter BT1, chloroplastic/mitochondrial-like [Pistacia vera]|uniref:adenine nucleotide transporter BT1, chloroplastic/mitochondrial-like n=1 Tax=Pistacia vera TaxID=55513 RepID=UPI0012638792|nr:adenine nucleotide transporter BT1, chloroplastic/mitochondrial-like [Pistacia vera]